MAPHNILLERLAERLRALEADHYSQPTDNRFKSNDIIVVHRSCYEEQGVTTDGLSPDDDGNIESRVLDAVFGGMGWNYEVEPTSPPPGPRLLIVVSERYDAKRMRRRFRDL